MCVLCSTNIYPGCVFPHKNWSAHRIDCTVRSAPKRCPVLLHVICYFAICIECTYSEPKCSFSSVSTNCTAKNWLFYLVEYWLYYWELIVLQSTKYCTKELQVLYYQGILMYYCALAFSLSAECPAVGGAGSLLHLFSQESNTCEMLGMRMVWWWWGWGWWWWRWTPTIRRRWRWNSSIWTVLIGGNNQIIPPPSVPPHCLHPPPGGRDQDGVPCPADYAELTHVRPSWRPHWPTWQRLSSPPSTSSSSSSS